MRTSKKLIAGVSAFIVAVSSVAITVSAVTNETEDFAISVSSVNDNVKAGETFEVTVDLANVPETGVAGFEFAVSYDADTVEFVSIVENKDIVGNASDKELELVPDLESTMVAEGAAYSCLDYYVSGGKVACMWATGLEDSDYWIKESGTLATVTFKVKDAVEENTSADIAITPILGEENGSIVFASVDQDGNYYAIPSLNQDNASLSVDVAPADTDTDTTTDTTTENPDDTSSNTPGESGLKGDIDVNGEVNAVDVLLVKKYVLTMLTDDDFTAQGLANADIMGNGDGVMANDLLLIKKYVLTMIDTLDGYND